MGDTRRCTREAWSPAGGRKRVRRGTRAAAQVGTVPATARHVRHVGHLSTRSASRGAHIRSTGGDESEALARRLAGPQRLHALETLADDLRGEGSFAQVFSAAQAAVEGDPLRESPRAALIRVHMAEGNVSDAIREFARYRELLQRELGLEPTPRLQALLDQGR